MALFIQMNARRFLGSFQEMTSYTDALSVITTLTTSSPWYCIAAFWWCLVLHLLKNHVPLDYPFSCIAGRTHTISVYTGLHTLPLILLAEHRWCSLARNPKSVSFLIWYYCQPVPGNTVTPHSLLWSLTQGADLGDSLLAEEMKHIHLPCCCIQMKKAKTNSDTACWTLLRHSSSLGCLPWDPNLQRWLSSSLSPPFSFYSQLCQLSIPALQKEDILNPEIWNIESYPRDHLVYSYWFINRSEEPPDLPNTRRATHPHTPQREKWAGPQDSMFPNLFKWGSSALICFIY